MNEFPLGNYSKMFTPAQRSRVCCVRAELLLGACASGGVAAATAEARGASPAPSACPQAWGFYAETQAPTLSAFYLLFLRQLSWLFDST